MELQPAGTTPSTQKKIYEKPRIEIVNLIADEMVLGSVACRDPDNSGQLNPGVCTPMDLCRNS